MHDPHYSIFAGAGIIGALLGPVFGPLVMLLFAAVMGGLLAMGRTSTRTVAGTAVGCPEGTPFKPVWADYDFNTLVIGLGRNNLNISERPTVKRDVEACVKAQRTAERRIFILTVTNGGSITPGVPTNEGIGTSVGDSVVALELWSESTFTGPSFEVVNIRKLLMQHGDGSADDNADIAAGTVPRSLRTACAQHAHSMRKCTG